LAALVAAVLPLELVAAFMVDEVDFVVVSDFVSVKKR